MKLNKIFSEKLKRFTLIYVEIITMPTLIKLLAIKIVAKSFFGFSSNVKIIFELRLFFSSRYFFSEGLIEKKATSDPDTKAEQISKKMIAMIEPVISGVNTWRKSNTSISREWIISPTIFQELHLNIPKARCFLKFWKLSIVASYILMIIIN